MRQFEELTFSQHKLIHFHTSRVDHLFINGAIREWFIQRYILCGQVSWCKGIFQKGKNDDDKDESEDDLKGIAEEVKKATKNGSDKSKDASDDDDDDEKDEEDEPERIGKSIF